MSRQEIQHIIVVARWRGDYQDFWTNRLEVVLPWGLPAFLAVFRFFLQPLRCYGLCTPSRVES